ncbi:Tetratricopeptide repeat protein [Candidatus Bilamarchaeum dharawalense]|uniref:Tetratricopeptide repeat protein n=1 Tax=Candidatus Bilamarchaeum dharawalense TaxID=2885759 RepID=A0A5E4LVR6_9ARCH|nr:Tetratricopeptide repeat protein [Candidatus Bilamarchaeum dharawalense]
MAGFDEARNLLTQQRYKEAASVLDRVISENKNKDEFWYLRGVVSLKLRNYDVAQECFERALLLDRKSKYYQIKGMAHFELFEIEDAVEAFLNALALEPNNAATNFFLSICYLFLDDPRSDFYIRKAHNVDSKKTKQLLLNFYTFFLKNDPRMSPAMKAKVEAKLHDMRS